MAKLKYINFENLGIIIFEEGIEHAILARKIGDTPISAGFCFLPYKDDNDNVACCFGESISLGIKSNEAVDSKILQRKLSPYGR